MQAIAVHDQQLSAYLSIVKGLRLSKLPSDDAGVGSQAAGLVRCDQTRADVADADKFQRVAASIELGNGQRTATGTGHGLMNVFQHQQR
ncbi:hypothetical protein D3C72_1877810 [compost metagenome]